MDNIFIRLNKFIINTITGQLGIEKVLAQM
jgi:hypothetical protein